MRRLLPLALLVPALGAVLLLRGCEESSDPTGAAPVNASRPGDSEEPPRIEKWRYTTVFGVFRLSLPESFTDRERMRHISDGVVFFGLEEDGFRPNVHLYWTRHHRADTIDRWFDWNRKKLANDRRYEIIHEGNARIAGLPARYLVYRQRSGAREFQTIDWYFVRGGKGGILRGVATRRQFIRYRTLFDAIARLLRYEPRR